MFCFPNSFDKLWLNARSANLPAAKALVVTLPLKLAVAPVINNVPLLPLSSSSFALNARMACWEKAKAPVMLVCTMRSTS